jgi:hypothetical protein
MRHLSKAIAATLTLLCGEALALPANLAKLPAKMSLHRPSFYMPNPARSDMPDIGSSTLFLRDNAEDGTSTYLGKHRLDRPAYRANSQESDSEIITTYFRSTTGCADLDLVVLSQQTRGDTVVYGCAQALNHIPILGTYAVAEVYQDTVQYARDFLIKPPRLTTQATLPASRAAQIAQSAIKADAQQAKATTAPLLAIYVHQEVPKLIYQVGMDSEAPWSFWTVFVDAQTGEVLRRDQSGLDAHQGQITGPVERRCANGTVDQRSMPHIQWSVGYAADDEGRFESDMDLGSLQVSFNGAFFRIDSYGNAPMQTITSTPDPEGRGLLAITPASIAQTTPYYHLSRARQFVLRSLGDDDAPPFLRLRSWLKGQIPVRVNLPSGYKGFSCNAFYNGRSLNFYQADPVVGCQSSSRTPKVIIHEFFHGVHDHLTANEHTFDHQVSEGIADFGAAIVTGEPDMTGFMGCDDVMRGRSNLRTCVNEFNYCRSKRCDSYPGDEPHNAGPVLAGALWELRTHLIRRHGPILGEEKTAEFLMRFMSVVTDMGSAYSAAIAADEDDDDNPANGTIHSCEINNAFLQTGREAKGHFPNSRRQAVPCVPIVGRPPPADVEAST